MNWVVAAGFWYCCCCCCVGRVRCVVGAALMGVRMRWCAEAGAGRELCGEWGMIALCRWEAAARRSAGRRAPALDPRLRHTLCGTWGKLKVRLRRACVRASGSVVCTRRRACLWRGNYTVPQARRAGCCVRVCPVLKGRRAHSYNAPQTVDFLHAPSSERIGPRGPRESATETQERDPIHRAVGSR